MHFANQYFTSNSYEVSGSNYDIDDMGFDKYRRVLVYLVALIIFGNVTVQKVLRIFMNSLISMMQNGE